MSTLVESVYRPYLIMGESPLDIINYIMSFVYRLRLWEEWSKFKKNAESHGYFFYPYYPTPSATSNILYRINHVYYENDHITGIISSHFIIWYYEKNGTWVKDSYSRFGLFNNLNTKVATSDLEFGAHVLL